MGAANGIVAGQAGPPGSELAQDGARPASCARGDPGRAQLPSDMPAAHTARQPAQPVTVPSHLAVVLGGPARSPRAYRVEAPGRLLRVWALLSAGSEELHQVQLPPAALPRLQRQLRAATTELQRSLSPALAGELSRLLRHDGTEPVTIGKLRIEYATVLGWTGGLVIAMLNQLEQHNAAAIQAAARPASASS
jgi:hypothetical protein